MIQEIEHDLKSVFTRTNYVELSSQYAAAYDWFKSFGFDVAATRLRVYKQCIDDLATHFRQDSIDMPKFWRNFPNQASALFEAVEILRIHRGLTSLKESGFESELKAKVSVVLKGRYSRPSPSEFDPCRDIAFELLLATRCWRAGLRCEIGTQADLIIPFNGTILFVECKRLKSSGQVRKHIKYALKQLHRRYKSATSPGAARGILALSLTDLVNPTHGLVVGSSVNDVNETMSRHVDAFIENQRTIWKNPADRRTIGSFVEFSAPSVIESENLFATAHSFAMNNSCSQISEDFGILMDFATKLAGEDA
jgi:hypothetical protein